VGVSAECFEAIALALTIQLQQLPTPQLIGQLWPQIQQGWVPTAQQAYLSGGGTVALALAHVIDDCCHTSADVGLWDDGWDAGVGDDQTQQQQQQQGMQEEVLGGQKADLPVCENDGNYNMVFDVLLGGLVPRKLPGCLDCQLGADDDEPEPQ
jgi:hypothetical protein